MSCKIWGYIFAILCFVGIPLAFIGHLTNHITMLIVGTVMYCIGVSVGVGTLLYLALTNNG